MKKGIKRRILAGLAAATLAGCSLDSSNAVSPEYENSDVRVERNIGRDRKGEVESYYERTGDLQGSIEKTRNKINLENRIDVENTINDFSSSRKPAQTGPIIVDFDARIADYNNDHIVDFTDFFRFADNFGRENGEYNLVGDNIVDFDDFFAFADQFGKSYNRRPMTTNLTSDNGDNINVGDEAVLNAHATDREGDVLRYNWSIRKQGTQNEELEVNGGILRKLFNEAGTYNIFVRAIDSFGAQSNELSRILNVRHSGPVLSLPDEISFSQWTGGAEGNVYRLNLDDYVSDPNFSDRDLTWSFNVEGNEFTFWPRLPFWFDYTEKALHLDLDGDRILNINPIADYNTSDYGNRYIDFTVANPDGGNVGKRVKVNVRRIAEFDDPYDDVVTGGGWNEPPKYFYIWIGNGRTEDGEWPLSESKGPKPTQGEIDYFIRTAEMVPKVSDFFKPLEIRYTDSWDEWVGNRDNGAVLAYIDNYAWNGGTTSSSYKNYSWVTIGANSSNKTDRFYQIGLHEMLDHGVGMDHPGDDRDELFYATIFSGGNRLDYVPNRDKAIIDSFYETKQY